MKKTSSMFSLLFLSLILFITLSSFAAEKTREEMLEEEEREMGDLSRRIADQFYTLEEGQDFREITEDILNSSDTESSIKDIIMTTGRRFFLFEYPSDQFRVKGYISFVPDAAENPLLILLRGGNNLFALMHPATNLSCMRNYTVIATAYRGGVSEGEDEYGGADVNDVNNLMLYFPTLQEKIEEFFSPSKTFILGGSRGGMQLFLALSRFPELQDSITKAVSLSGLLDMRENMLYRQDLREMLMEQFGLTPENEEEWITYRNPVDHVNELRENLPVLILQGRLDIRVNLEEGYNMVKKLQERGLPVTYLEVPDGDHCLKNQENRAELIAEWLEE